MTEEEYFEKTALRFNNARLRSLDRSGEVSKESLISELAEEGEVHINLTLSNCDRQWNEILAAFKTVDPYMHSVTVIVESADLK